MAQNQSQTTPSTLQDNAQRVLRYYDRQDQPVPKAPVDPLHQLAQPGNAKAVRGGGHFLLREVVFTPSALLTGQELAAAVAPCQGKQVTTADLDALLDRVNALYTAHHITTARAVLQNQTIADGVVHVELVEGRLGKVTVQGTRHVHDRFIRSRIHQQAGEVVDANRLRDDLVYLNRTTDLQTRALLEPGAERGQTDVRLNVQEPDRHTLDAFVDNNGVDSTGRTRVGLQGHLYGIFGVDDALDGNIAHSRGGNDGSIAYSVPLAPSNGRLGISYAHSQINVIDDAFRDISIHGTSSVASLNYNQPFVATMNWLVSGIGAYSQADSTTEISGERIADTKTRSITLGLSFGHQKDGQLWNVTQLFTRLHSDEPLLGKSNFVTAPGSAYFVQRLGQSSWALRSDAGWQFSTGKNIPSANLFQIGGTGSVRGYQRGVLGGARGYYVDLELHRSFGERVDLFSFVDHGAVYAFYPDNKSISGAGLGAMYRYRWLTASADVAKPFNTVIPNQDSVRVDFRIAAHWN